MIDGHFHLIERLAPFCGRGEGRSIGGGKIRLATGEELQVLPAGWGSDAFPCEDALRLLDEHQIETAVLLQSGFYGFQNDYAAECARRYPGRFYPAAGVDPYCESCESILAHLIGELGMRALKFEISASHGLAGCHPGFRVDGPEMRRVYGWARQYGMAIAFDVGGPAQESYQIGGLRAIVAQYPSVRFVFCHLLCPGRPGAAGWEEDIRALAKENVWFDFSGLPGFLDEKPPYPAAAAYIGKAARMVGAGKLIWGSDAPGALKGEGYAALAAYYQLPGRFSAGDLERMTRQNAVDAYAIPRPAPHEGGRGENDDG